MKKYISKIIIFAISILLMYCTKSYCVESGTVRMQITSNGTAWTNINVSESYAECESLNSATSTLGTTMLEAHLTTDADWSAMAIFSVSQYGGATTNAPKKTNGNDSGIYDIGAKASQTTGILNTANKNSTLYVSGLFNEDGSVKKYIRQWSPNRTETNFVGFNETFGWMGSWAGYGNSTSYPVSIRNGLFGVFIGGSILGDFTSGGAFDSVSFRPVIWN